MFLDNIWCDLFLRPYVSPLFNFKQDLRIQDDATESIGIRHSFVSGAFPCHMTSLTTSQGEIGTSDPLYRWGMEAQTSGGTCSRSHCLLVMASRPQIRSLNSLNILCTFKTKNVVTKLGKLLCLQLRDVKCAF